MFELIVVLNSLAIKYNVSPFLDVRLLFVILTLFVMWPSSLSARSAPNVAFILLNLMFVVLSFPIQLIPYALEPLIIIMFLVMFSLLPLINTPCDLLPLVNIVLLSIYKSFFITELILTATESAPRVLNRL